MSEPLSLVTVFPSPDGWRVCFHDAAELRALLSTDTRPSAFTRLAEPELVVQGTLQRHPRHRIQLICGDGTTVQTEQTLKAEGQAAMVTASRVSPSENPETLGTAVRPVSGGED